MDDLTKLIGDELRAYNEEVDETTQSEIDAITDEVLYDLRNNPVIPQRTGDYARSFYKKKLAQGVGYKRNVVANKEHQLTHLLEDGHATASGGRTRAFPHWKQAEEIVENLDERMARKLSGT